LIPSLLTLGSFAVLVFLGTLMPLLVPEPLFVYLWISGSGPTCNLSFYHAHTYLTPRRPDYVLRIIVFCPHFHLRYRPRKLTETPFNYNLSFFFSPNRLTSLPCPALPPYHVACKARQTIFRPCLYSSVFQQEDWPTCQTIATLCLPIPLLF